MENATNVITAKYNKKIDSYKTQLSSVKKEKVIQKYSSASKPRKPTTSIFSLKIEISMKSGNF